MNGNEGVCALIMEEKMMTVVKKTCRCMLKVSCEKKYCSITYGGQHCHGVLDFLRGNGIYLTTYEELQRERREHI